MNFFKEEEADRLRDRRMERGGGDGNTRYNRPARSGGTQPNTAGKKKPYDGMSALEKVKADIRAKHGKGAIIDTKKKTKTEGYAPGDVDQKVGAVTPIPKKDQDDARARILAKAKAKRAARLKSEGVIAEKKDCVKKEKKTKHNCAKKVCTEQWGVGECIAEMHTLDEQGNITHYDVLFDHGVEQNVPVELITTLVSEMHEHAINHEKNEIVEKKGLWANIHAKRKRGEKPAKKGDKDYPETLKVEGSLNERGDFWHPDPEKDKKLGGPGANQRAREDRAAASKPKEDSKKLKPGESYMDYAKRQKASRMKKEDKSFNKFCIEGSNDG